MSEEFIEKPMNFPEKCYKIVVGSKDRIEWIDRIVVTKILLCNDFR